MKAQDIIPDGQDFTVIDGHTVRKGSVGAFLANARVLEDANATADERRVARDDLAALIPTLDALGLFDVFELRSPALRDEVARHRVTLSPAPAASPRA
ncbi:MULTISPECIES: hypothetical protein [Variovorax]|uniref:Preprotein translocase subunit SecD n=1 Tax=Variovorax boronicumulans TaxID=436515 RepID=A0A250DMQ9_9BURK|nr:MULTISPECIES: hypothetical protein [Variovorax]ATA55665.1 hypothetical protein CKY39_22370 [Variovorax boronicumulans]MDP9875809.1 hypothetical protein [Variovorax boronicumulans]MDP9921091.1 hypothetical protein [Variovorax boronicumulans]TSD59095.1 hypothetical protein FFI97_001825 [Variovorax sp. KBS0712]GER10061.1 hypothetical protein VHAB30_12150 [Variovorax boronicumulans]